MIDYCEPATLSTTEIDEQCYAFYLVGRKTIFMPYYETAMSQVHLQC